MLNNLNAKFDQLGNIKFLTLSAILSFLCDAINIVYMLVSYLPITINNKMLHSVITAQGLSLSSLNITELNEIRQLFIQTFGMIFLIVLMIHAGIYFLLARNKTWAKNYVSGYSILGAIMTLVMLPSMVFQFGHIIWAIIMFATTFFYFFVYFGLRHFKKLEIKN